MKIYKTIAKQNNLTQNEDVLMGMERNIIPPDQR